LAAALRIASLIVDEIQQVLGGSEPGEPVEVRLDPATGLRRLRPVHNETCLFDHQVLTPVVQLEQQAQELSLADIFSLAGQSLGAHAETLWLRQPAATAFVCAAGHAWKAWHRLKSGISNIFCPQCRRPGLATGMTWQISRRAGAECPTLLAALVPPADVLSFTSADNRAAIHLALKPPAAWQPRSLMKEKFNAFQ
jgi:hypothetical protein